MWPGLFARGLQFGDAGDVDNHAGGGEAQVQHGAERLPARHDLGVIAGTDEQGHGLRHRARAQHLEGGRFHAALLFAARAASTFSMMRRGVTGECSISTPSGRSASLMALVMAAGGAMAPPSPMPFTPKRV